MEGQSPPESSQYQYQSAQWSRLLRRNVPAGAAADDTFSHPTAFAPSPHSPHLDLVPILLPQHSTFHQAQLAQYNKLISSARGARLQTSPLPPLLSAEHIQAVPRQRSRSPRSIADRNTKTSSRGGHGNREPRKPSKGERALIAEKADLATMAPKKFELPSQLPSRPLAQHQNSSLSHQSNSVPTTPHQHARKFSFESREPSPNADTSHSPRSAYSESDTKLNSLRPLPPRFGGCRFETAMAHTRRRMPYSIGSERLEKPEPSSIKSKLTEDEERTLSTDMRELYDRLLPTQESESKRRKLVQKLEKLLNEEWPGHDIRVHMFGSSGNMLCTDDSDVDICITTEWKQLEGVCMIAELLARNGMQKVICVSTAKVPIVKIWDPELSLACDMNVNNTLALENTRMIKTYVEIDDRVRPLAMIIKHWTKQRALNDAAFGSTLSSYTWICMIINFLQTRDPAVVPPLHQRQHLKLPSKNGQESSFADDVEALKTLCQKNTETLGELLFQFFRFYGHEFDYDHCVVSVRNGKQITKKEKKWHFGSGNNNLCVEEPFNVSRNLGNTADDTSFRGLHMELRRAFDLISEAKLKECCETYEFPEEEKVVYERPRPQPKPILTRSASQSNRAGRNNHHGRRGNQHGRNSNGNRRASSGAFDSGSSYVAHGMPPNMTAENVWLQQQAQAQLHNELFTKYTVLQQEEIRLRQYQAFQQHQAAHQAQVYAAAQTRKSPNGSTPKQQPADRNRTSTLDQPPLTAPIRPDMYFYPLHYQPTPVYAYQGPSTNPSSPSMSSALPELRRSVHRSSVTNGSSSNSAQSTSTLRSHSQPATRSVSGPLSVQGAPMPDQGLGIYQAMHYAHGPPVPNFMADENLDPTFDGMSTRPSNRIRRDDSPKEYVGYYFNNSAAATPRRQPQSSLAIPAFGDLGQNRRRLSTDQFPQAIFDRLNRTSRSPSPLGEGGRDRSCSVDVPFAANSSIPPQHSVSSTNLRALNNQGPLVVNGSNIPMPTVASSWQTPKSDQSGSDYHTSETPLGSYGSLTHGSDGGSEASNDLGFSGHTTPKNGYTSSDRIEQPLVVNGSFPTSRPEEIRAVNGASPVNGFSSHHDPTPTNGLTSTDQLSGVLRMSPTTQRSGRPAQNGNMSPLDIGFGQSDATPHLSPVYETRTPSPTANRKFEHGMERTSNSTTGKPRDNKVEQLNTVPKFAPINGSHLKPSSPDTKSNGHTRASKSEGNGPGSWQKASKQKKKGQSSEHKTVFNGHPLSEKLPRNDSERKGG